MATLHQPIVSPVLIGRTQEIELLTHGLQVVRQGQGHCYLIAGEAGVGKSRLVAELKTRAPQLGFTCWQGSCFEPDHALPYAPLLELFRGNSPLEKAELVPHLDTLLTSAGATPVLEPEQEQRRLFLALVQFLKSVTEKAGSPLLFIIEDLHWSDDSTLEFLLFLARRMAAQPILLVLTYRHDETQSGLYYLLAELDRARLATELVLPRLAPAEVEAMIRAIFDLAQPVRGEFLDAICALTEGNPFFVEEILKSLVTAGEIFYGFTGWTRKPLQELDIPRTVQDAVRRRTRQLSEPARHLLTVAAVVGRRFDFSLLRELTGRSETELLTLVKELLAAQLVVEESAETFAFRHALTQQAIYTHLLQRERQVLHGAIAAALENRPAESAEAHLMELAHHFFRAAAWEKALNYSKQAGAKAQAMHAPGAAQEHFTHALEAVGHLPELKPMPELYRARGQVRELLGDFEAARQDYDRALEIARQSQDRLAEWQSLFDLGFLLTAHDFELAGNYLQQALTLARALDDASLLGHSLNRIGNWQLMVGQPGEGQQCHQEAYLIFKELHDKQALAETLDLLGITHYLSGQLSASVSYYKQAIDLFRELNDRRGLSSALAPFATRGANYLCQTTPFVDTTLAECLQEGEEAIQLAHQIGWRSGEASAYYYLGLGLGPRGEYSRALNCARSALELATEIEHNVWMATAQMLLGVLYLDLLALPRAQQHLEPALELAREIGSAFMINGITGFLAANYIAQQDFLRAEAVLGPNLELRAPPKTQAQRLVRYAQAELALAQGRAELALSIVEELITLVQPEPPAETVIPRLEWIRGGALTALGRLSEAETTLRLAAQVAMAQETPPILWRIQVSLGKLYQTQGRPDQAEASFALARNITQELAAKLEDMTLGESFLAAANDFIPQLPAPSPRRAVRQTLGGLTKRERQVATLVAQGKSNRLLAEELVISERTVEKHIENIMSKLDFTSRVQIAAWAIEKGLTARLENQGDSPPG